MSLPSSSSTNLPSDGLHNDNDRSSDNQQSPESDSQALTSTHSDENEIFDVAEYEKVKAEWNDDVRYNDIETVLKRKWDLDSDGPASSLESPSQVVDTARELLEGIYKNIRKSLDPSILVAYLSQNSLGKAYLLPDSTCVASFTYKFRCSVSQEASDDTDTFVEGWFSLQRPPTSSTWVPLLETDGSICKCDPFDEPGWCEARMEKLEEIMETHYF